MTSESQAGELALKRAEMLVKMADTITSLSEETRALRSDVKDLSHRRRNEMIVAVIGVVLLIAVLFLVIRISVIQKDNHTTLQTVQSATDPSGAIYQAGQKATAAAIAQIVQTVILADQCIHDNSPDIQACVNSKVRATP